MFTEKLNPQKISQGRKVANVKKEMCKLGIKNMQFKHHQILLDLQEET